MEVSTLVKEMAATCVSILHRVDAYPSAGVLVQGSNYPVALSALHGFACHGEASLGQRLEAILQAPEQAIEVEVVALDHRYDIIAFKVLTDIQGRRTAHIDTDPMSSCIGKPYFMFGYSSCKMVDPDTNKWVLTWRMTPGHIATDLSPYMTVAISGGCVPGDSGGPLFSVTSGCLMGINISVSRLHQAIPDEQCLRMRNSPEGNAIPAWFLFHAMGEDFLKRGGGPAYFNSSSIQAASINNGGMQNSAFDIDPPAHVFYCGSSGTSVDLDTFIESMNEALDPYKF